MHDASGSAYWSHLEALLRSHRVVIDRPAGSTHPRFPSFFYPYDYGFLESTQGGDAQPIDVWLGSGDRAELSGVVCTVDLQKRDAEVKLLVGCNLCEMQNILRVHNNGPQAAMLIVRPSDGVAV